MLSQQLTLINTSVPLHELGSAMQDCIRLEGYDDAQHPYEPHVYGKVVARQDNCQAGKSSLAQKLDCKDCHSGCKADGVQQATIEC